MTGNEFKFWLDGFSENMEGPPSDEQWKRIREQADKIMEPSVITPSDVTTPWTFYPRWDNPVTPPTWTSSNTGAIS